MRKLIAIATLSTAAIAGGAVLAGTASAAGPTGVIKRPATSYISPSTVSQPVHHLIPNTSVDVLCFTEGQEIYGNHVWFRIRKDGQNGFVHRDAIAPSGDIRHC